MAKPDSRYIRSELSVSQNFLKSSELVANLIRSSSIGLDDLVVEIGPGKGTITFELAKRCRRVLGVEWDQDLYRGMERAIRSNDIKNVELANRDFLTTELPNEPYKVFANIPFNLTSDIVRKLLQATHPPVDSFLVMQRAAAERFAGAPFGKDSQMSVLWKPLFDFSISHEFAPTDFRPKPRVRTVLLRIERRGTPLVASDAMDLYRDFVVYTFNAWKPNVEQALAKIIPRQLFVQLAKQYRISPGSKPSELSIEQWIGLFEGARKDGNRRALARVKGSSAKHLAQQSELQKINRTREARDWRNHKRK